MPRASVAIKKKIPLVLIEVRPKMARDECQREGDQQLCHQAVALHERPASP